MTTQTSTADRSHRKAPRYLVIAAWAAPIMVLTGWAFFAAVPVALITWATWTDARIRPLRWWASLMAGLYAIPFLQYLTAMDTYGSMSKMLHPLLGVAIALPAIVIIAKLWKSHRG